jgi:hypothetical protein
MNQITWAQWVQFIIVVLILLGMALTALSHLNFIAKNAAFATIVAGAQQIVNQIVAVLEADPTASKTTLVQSAVAELRVTFASEIAKIGIKPAAVEPSLALIVQRLIAGAPMGLKQIVQDVEKSTPAALGPNAALGRIKPIVWNRHFNHDVGDV